ncbi:MAG: secretion protein F [Clostridia bacterium]|nr:secretion protein F [Clostridia bacterium]
MIPLLFVFGLSLASGFYFLAAGVLRLPSMGAAKAITERGSRKQKATGFLEDGMDHLSILLARHITLDEYKKRRMGNILKAAGMGMTPELHAASCMVKSGVTAIPVLPCLLFLPLVTPVPVFAAVAVYFRETRKPEEKLREKRDRVEQELPRFVATIEQDLKSSRDVLSILESFKKNTSDTFRTELDILTADMRSGSYEAALTRFEARLNSPMLSDVVRGLIGVLKKKKGGGGSHG